MPRREALWAGGNPPCLPAPVPTEGGAGRLFQRGKYFSSLWQRGVGRDFMKPFSKP